MRTGYAALEPGNADPKYLHTTSPEQSKPGTGSPTGSSRPTGGVIPEATEAVQGARDEKPSAKTSARIDGNESGESNPSQRADYENSFRTAMSRYNGSSTPETKNDRMCNVARESRFSFAEGDDAFTTGAVDADTFQPCKNQSETDSTKRSDDDGLTDTATRAYEHVRQSQATPTQVSSRLSPVSAWRTTSLGSKENTSGAVEDARRPSRPHLEGRPLTWSRSPKVLARTPARTAEDVFAGNRSHGSAGSFNTVIRADSSRSSQSIGSLSLTGDSDLSQGSPSRPQRVPGPQRRMSAQIAASLAVARDKSRQSSHTERA